MKKKDHHVELFMGTTYTLEARTVGELRAELESLASDLPTDGTLKLAELYLKDKDVCYTLEEGIPE